ncbi:MAG: 8-amino-7-oxononanoate synthase [Dissulfurispiraceae bacterium]|jgi:8-amino-7-oxononanoate synthase
MWFDNDLRHLDCKGLRRKIYDRGIVSEAQRIPSLVHVEIEGTEYVNFASNDYLGLAASPTLVNAAKQALAAFPFGAGASRLLCGGTTSHMRLEEAVARFKKTEAALVFNSGYQANVSGIPALTQEGDVIFSDELNHASIVDGCRLSKAKRVIYKHLDVDHLSSLMHKECAARKIVISDTVFSMDGDIAPVGELYALCAGTPNTILYVDDAHGTGVLGGGHGALAHFNLKSEPWIVQMGTFSKALGSFGAFVAGSHDLVNWLINTARGFIYSTALPACVIAASNAALAIIESDNSIVERLWWNQRRAVEGIVNAGFDIICKDTPIIAVLVGDLTETLDFSLKLKQHRIYAPAIRPPTVRTPRIRVTVSAAHTDEDIESLIKAFSVLR